MRRPLDALLELEARLPAEFLLEFCRVDGVAHVMAGTVGDIGDEAEVLAFPSSEKPVHGLDQELDDVDVLPLVETTDVVGLSDPSVMEYGVDGPCVVLDEQPVTHVLALTIDRKGFAVADVVDEQRYKLLRELVRAVVVRAVGHDGRHTIGVVVGSDEMVRRCLGCRIWTVRGIFACLAEEIIAIGKVVASGRCLRGERRPDPLRMVHLQSAINLIS